MNQVQQQRNQSENWNLEMFEDNTPQLIQFRMTTVINAMDFRSEVVHHAPKFGNFDELGASSFALGLGVGFAR